MRNRRIPQPFLTCLSQRHKPNALPGVRLQNLGSRYILGPCTWLCYEQCYQHLAHPKHQCSPLSKTDVDGKWQLSRAGGTPSPPHFLTDTLCSYQQKLEEQIRIWEHISDTPTDSGSGSSWHSTHQSAPLPQEVGTPSETKALSPNLSHTHTLDSLEETSAVGLFVPQTVKGSLADSPFPDPQTTQGPLQPPTGPRRNGAHPAMTNTIAEESHNSCEG